MCVDFSALSRATKEQMAFEIIKEAERAKGSKFCLFSVNSNEELATLTYKKKLKHKIVFF